MEEKKLLELVEIYKKVGHTRKIKITDDKLDLFKERPLTKEEISELRKYIRENNIKPIKTYKTRVDELETYKNHKIVKKFGVITIINPDGSEFIPALDDSKFSGGRKIIESTNTVENAKKYIKSNI